MSKEQRLLESASGATVHLVILGEGEYDVPLPADRPVALAEFLAFLGISDRAGQWYLDGRPAGADAEVRPDSQALILPHLIGG